MNNLDFANERNCLAVELMLLRHDYARLEKELSLDDGLEVRAQYLDGKVSLFYGYDDPLDQGLWACSVLYPGSDHNAIADELLENLVINYSAV